MRLKNINILMHRYVRTNISDTLSTRLACHFFVPTAFWRHLWSITEHTHGNMESICALVATQLCSIENPGIGLDLS